MHGERLGVRGVSLRVKMENRSEKQHCGYFCPKRGLWEGGSDGMGDGGEGAPSGSQEQKGVHSPRGSQKHSGAVGA